MVLAPFGLVGEPAEIRHVDWCDIGANRAEPRAEDWRDMASLVKIAGKSAC
jgi:hypothetical protein